MYKICVGIFGEWMGRHGASVSYFGYLHPFKFHTTVQATDLAYTYFVPPSANSDNGSSFSVKSDT